MSRSRQKTIGRRRLGVAFLFLAAALLLAPQYVRPQSTAGEPIKIDQQLLSETVTGHSPLRMIIPKLQMDVPVVEARVVNGYWELSEVAASFGVGSAYPGQTGNTVIFAHARERLFLPLRQAEPDMIVYVLTDTVWHRYKISNVQLVNPDQVEVIAPSQDERLTLYTCSGFLDSKRLIVTATPDMVN